MSYDSALPLTIGRAVAAGNSSLEGLLGTLWTTPDGKTYRLCKANGAVAAAASKVVQSSLLSGVPTWQMSISTTAYKQRVRAVVPAGQVGSTGTTGLIDGDYFLAQVSGPSVAQCAAALAVGGSLLLICNSLGQLKASTLTTAIAARASVGFSTHTAATTIAGASFGVQLVGLI